MSFLSVPLSPPPVTSTGGPFPIDLHPFVSRLKPGMRLVVLMFEGAADTAGHEREAPRQGGTANPTEGLSDHEEVGDDATPMDIAAAMEECAQHEALRIDEWADRFRGSSISARELTRGVRGGWIPHVKKGSGRDHKAQLIRPADMVRYLEMREEGLRPGGYRPDWFGSVVMETPYVA